MPARGITAVIIDDGSKLKGNIAGVNPQTGKMYLNGPLIRQMRLSKDVILFIMLHEMGHLVLQTDNEEAVDRWAQEEYMKRGYSLKQSVFALTKILRFDKPEDLRRANNQLTRAMFFDQNNKSKK